MEDADQDSSSNPRAGIAGVERLMGLRISIHEGLRILYSNSQFVEEEVLKLKSLFSLYIDLDRLCIDK